MIAQGRRVISEAMVAEIPQKAKASAGGGHDHGGMGGMGGGDMF